MCQKNNEYKVSDKMYDLFCSEVTYWQIRFGLQDWRIMLSLDEDPNDSYLAETRYNPDSRAVLIHLAHSFDIPVTTKEICRTAFHEVLHILFADLLQLTKKGETIEHGLIRIFENTLFQDNHNMRYNKNGKLKKG